MTSKPFLSSLSLIVSPQETGHPPKPVSRDHSHLLVTTWPRDCCGQHHGIQCPAGDGAEAAEKLLAWVGSGTSEPGLQVRCVENLAAAGWKDKAEGQVEPDSELTVAFKCCHCSQWCSALLLTVHSFFQMNCYVLPLYE